MKIRRAERRLSSLRYKTVDLARRPLRRSPPCEAMSRPRLALQEVPETLPKRLRLLALLALFEKQTVTKPLERGSLHSTLGIQDSGKAGPNQESRTTQNTHQK